MYNILEEMHRAYQPLQITTWVDDCPQVHVGDLSILENHAPEAAIHFATLLSKRGFAISPKTTIISSNTSTAKVVQHKLKAKNISVRVSDNGRDVGLTMLVVAAAESHSRPPDSARPELEGACCRK